MQESQSLQLSLTFFFCCRAALMPLLDPDFTSQAFQTTLKSSCGICVMGLSLPSYSHFHISGVLVQLEKNVWGLPRWTGLERLSLPANCDTATSRRAREESGKEDDGRVLCHFLAVYKSRPLTEKHMKSISDTPWFFFLPSSSFSALPFSPCQTFKVCNDAVVIYSSLSICPSDSVQSITPFNFTPIPKEL